MGMLNKILFLILFIGHVEARPISYSGGSTMMTMSNNMKESIYYHYSPTYKYSVGIESVKDKFLDKDYLYLRLTYLLNRKNTKNSQRNLYFQSAISPNNLNDNFYGIHGDWETRRLFFRLNQTTIEVIEQEDNLPPNDKMWGLAWDVKNIEKAHQRLEDAGVEVTPIQKGIKEKTLVATVKSHTHNVPTLFIQHLD